MHYIYSSFNNEIPIYEPETEFEIEEEPVEVNEVE